jgi:hypothetical protein
MVVVAVFAVDWVIVRAAVDASERVIAHDLSLNYSWCPDLQLIQKGEPVYTDADLFGAGDITTGLTMLAGGGIPMASLLGLCVIPLLRNLVLRGRCSPFLLGFVVSGTAALAAYAACCALATEWTSNAFDAARDIVLYVPAKVFNVGQIHLTTYVAASSLAVGFLPMVLVALLGGTLNKRKLHVALVVLPHTEVDLDEATRI